MLKRCLEATEASPAELGLATFQSLIRLGNERDLLKSDWNARNIYRQARTDSSHACDVSKAEAVLGIAPQFLNEAKVLLGKLQCRGI